MISVFI
jgi:hypothetical protein